MSKLQFVHLDEYSILTILDTLNFVDLLQLADVNTTLRQLITRYHMKSKYHIHDRQICLNDKNQAVNIGQNPISLGNYHQILQLLRIFGHLITKLELCDQCFKQSDIPRISHYIARFSSQSLQELSLYRCKSYLTSESKQIFSNVVKLRIETSSLNEIDNFQIHRIYPMVECLTFSTAAFTFTSMIHKYPHLKCLTLDLFGTETKDSESLIGDLFRTNSQLIQLNLCMRSPPFDRIQCASETLPNLLSLTLHCTLDGFSTITNDKFAYFPNVIDLKMTIVGSSHPRIERFPMTFNGLEWLEIQVATVDDVPFELIEQSVALKHLALPITRWTHEFSRFSNLIQRFDALRVLQLKWSEDISRVEMRHLMETPRKLEEITVHVVGNKCRDEFIGMLPSTWRVDDIQSSIVYAFEMFSITILRETGQLS